MKFTIRDQIFALILLLPHFFGGRNCSCISTGPTQVNYFDSGTPNAMVFGSAMTVDQSTGHVYVGTSYPALLKLVDGEITHGISFSGWIPYGLALSANNARIIAVGHDTAGKLAVLEARSLALYSAK